MITKQALYILLTNKQKQKQTMENLTVQETVQLTIRVANFMEWYSFVWGCIGWALLLTLYYHHVKTTGKAWI
jgi:hypothetical protein